MKILLKKVKNLGISLITMRTGPSSDSGRRIEIQWVHQPSQRVIKNLVIKKM